MVFNLSFHTPENLYTELGLLATAVLIFAYRLLGGKNEWLRTHGVILVSYYAVGGIIYDELEGWPLLDSTYFLTVTITTVGYGDICPTTDIGKLFTVAYALVGIIFVFAALSPLVSILEIVKEFLISPCAPSEEVGDDISLDALRSQGNWGFKYGAALAGPGIIFVLGMGIGFFVMHLDTIDGIYWSMITMTTIGYGDISAHTWIERIVLCIYLPTAVAALADALAVVQQIGVAKMLIETDFAKEADTLLLGEAGGPQPNPDETLTEAEFLISCLKENGIVDDMTVKAIRLQFAHIVRHDTSDSDTKVLDDKILYLEMKAQGRVVQTRDGAPLMTARGRKLEQVDLNAGDGGFQEWREKHWWPRVFGENIDAKHQVRMAPVAQKTVVDAKGMKKQYQQQKDLESQKMRSKDPRDKDAPPYEKTLGGGYFSDGSAIADGEYVWMPFAEARRVRSKGDDKDTCLWWLLLLFVVYFVFKMLPTIVAYHVNGGHPDGAADDAARRLLAAAQPGETLSKELLAAINHLSRA